MKKLIIIAAVLAIAFAFLPKAEAGDSAELGLSVTFALEPLKLWTEPAGPFTAEVGQEFRFTLIAEDKDAALVTIEKPELPKWIVILEEKAYQDGDRYYRIDQTYGCNPKLENAQDEPYHFTVIAKNDNGEQVTITVDITVPKQPAISIELTPTTWELTGVKLGEVVSNRGPWIPGVPPGLPPIHRIANTGNVPVSVDMGYLVMLAPGIPGIRPGLGQGLDTFITTVMECKIIGQTQSVPPSYIYGWEEVVLPPGERKLIVHNLMPAQAGTGTKLSSYLIPLKYGAPTALSPGIKDHSVVYELRAYMATE